MALRTRLDLTIGRARTRTHGVACRRTHAPVNAASLVEPRGQSATRVGRRRAAFRPLNVARARTVTGFASDTDLRPARAESIGRCVVVLSHRGRLPLDRGAKELR